MTKKELIDKLNSPQISMDAEVRLMVPQSEHPEQEKDFHDILSVFSPINTDVFIVGGNFRAGLTLDAANEESNRLIRLLSL